MNTLSNKYRHLLGKSLSGESLNLKDAAWILAGEDLNLLKLLDAAFEVRQKYFDRGVKLHIINNVRSGNCTEDCTYCAQSKSSAEKIESYPMKSDTEIFNEAEYAHSSGAFRHCMVFSGNKASDQRVERISSLVKEIKQKFPMEICVSMGLLNSGQAKILKAAGVDRYNHNLNSSQAHYKNICTTHDYQKRLETIQSARSASLEVCSGIIIGLGESNADIFQILDDMRKLEIVSVPINFFVPVPGHRVKNQALLTPEYCLRVLALFRLALPKSEIRVAGGREFHLRSMQALSLYAANSLFAKGYLTTGGDSVEQTRQMIQDAGFYLQH